MTGTLRENPHSFLIVPRSVLLRMRHFETKVLEQLKTHIFCSVIFFFENLSRKFKFH